MGLEKIEVARGIHWVAVPEADLRVLCGCPADSVKHLIKRGLIVPHEVRGVLCETGPNAILLSDIPLQNGEFANLSEFPILQMLYRQGMLLPDHPNNTGRKPVLIGSAEQLESQLEYIRRGNYGLVSKEEIMQAGIPEKLAGDMLRLKLKFAFGKIQPSTQFVDTFAIEEDAVEIARGVTLRRLQTNLFEFAYRGRTVQVDLNLPPGSSYEMPYHLGFRPFESHHFSVIHSGEGDGWDANRPQMSSVITHQGKIYLVDAGPNIGDILSALGIGIDQIDGIFQTHVHDDHFAGLTVLMRAGRRIKYHATPLVRQSAMKKLAALIGIEGQFNEFFEAQDLVFDDWTNFDGLEVMAVFSPHPIETNILIFRALSASGYRTYAHLADIIALETLEGMITEDREAPGIDRESFERIRDSYLIPYDLKKIDVGGGMIHGSAGDFRNDGSGCLLLAHRATELTQEEKGIGSSAVFGAVDVLIRGRDDGFRRQAYFYLKTNLPNVPDHFLRTILDEPLTEINPGTIILREGETPKDILLLLSGHAEKISTRNILSGRVQVGSLIGDSAILGNRPSHYTFRASSFLRGLCIPVGLYIEVIDRNGLLDKVRRVNDLRIFLVASSLFNECLPMELLGKLVECVREREFPAGAFIGGEDLSLINIIRSGKVERIVYDRVTDILLPAQHFGEDSAVLNVPTLYRLRAAEATRVLQFPGEMVSEVPALRWKIFEQFQQRVIRQSSGFA